jgi:RecG-like helicase
VHLVQRNLSEGKFHAGQTVAVYGKVEPSRSTSNLKMIQPQFELLPDATDDAETRCSKWAASRRSTSRWAAAAWPRAGSARRSSTCWKSMRGAVPECLPQAMLARLGLPGRETALREVHFPPEGTPFAQLQSSATPAHRRLIFEELFFLELGLELKRRRMRQRTGIAFATTDKVREAIREVLPFHPTAAQKRALGEIVADMRQPSPMRRLLQGDVGSGKTIVALQAMLVAMENGYQAALMAPTEILATQHFLAARKLLERSSRRYRIVLLTGSLDEDRKRQHPRGLINRGEAQLVIGTHALIEEKVEFDRLGLVVVDEQHRFGVLQRFKLMKKPRPDHRGGRAGHAGDDRHAHSAHAGALALRRPGRERSGRAAARPHAHRHPPRSRRAWPKRCGISCASRWRRAGRLTSSTRSSRAARTTSRSWISPTMTRLESAAIEPLPMSSKPGARKAAARAKQRSCFPRPCRKPIRARNPG